MQPVVDVYVGVVDGDDDDDAGGDDNGGDFEHDDADGGDNYDDDADEDAAGDDITAMMRTKMLPVMITGGCMMCAAFCFFSIFLHGFIIVSVRMVPSLMHP